MMSNTGSTILGYVSGGITAVEKHTVQMCRRVIVSCATFHISRPLNLPQLQD